MPELMPLLLVVLILLASHCRELSRTDGDIVITTKSGTDKITFSGANATVTTSGDLIDLNGGDVLANNTNLTIIELVMPALMEKYRDCRCDCWNK